MEAALSALSASPHFPEIGCAEDASVVAELCTVCSYIWTKPQDSPVSSLLSLTSSIDSHALWQSLSSEGNHRATLVALTIVACNDLDRLSSNLPQNSLSKMVARFNSPAARVLLVHILCVGDHLQQLQGELLVSLSALKSNQILPTIFSTPICVTTLLQLTRLSLHCHRLLDHGLPDFDFKLCSLLLETLGTVSDQSVHQFIFQTLLPDLLILPESHLYRKFLFSGSSSDSIVSQSAPSELSSLEAASTTRSSKSSRKQQHVADRSKKRDRAAHRARAAATGPIMQSLESWVDDLLISPIDPQIHAELQEDIVARRQAIASQHQSTASDRYAALNARQWEHPSLSAVHQLFIESQAIESVGLLSPLRARQFLLSNILELTHHHLIHHHLNALKSLADNPSQLLTLVSQISPQSLELCTPLSISELLVDHRLPNSDDFPPSKFSHSQSQMHVRVLFSLSTIFWENIWHLALVMCWKHGADTARSINDLTLYLSRVC